MKYVQNQTFCATFFIFVNHKIAQTQMLKCQCRNATNNSQAMWSHQSSAILQQQDLNILSQQKHKKIMSKTAIHEDDIYP